MCDCLDYAKNMSNLSRTMSPIVHSTFANIAEMVYRLAACRILIVGSIRFGYVYRTPLNLRNHRTHKYSHWCRRRECICQTNHKTQKIVCFAKHKRAHILAGGDIHENDMTIIQHNWQLSDALWSLQCVSCCAPTFIFWRCAHWKSTHTKRFRCGHNDGAHL